MSPRPIAVVVAAAALLGGCVEPSRGTPSPADLEAFEVDPSVSVVVDEDGFEPDTVTVEANATIAVSNTGEDAHGLLQEDTRPDGRIETGDLAPGETVAVHLADPGEMRLVDPRTGATLTVEVALPTAG